MKARQMDNLSLTSIVIKEKFFTYDACGDKKLSS